MEGATQSASKPSFWSKLARLLRSPAVRAYEDLIERDRLRREAKEATCAAERAG
jgi:hypothetical protein